MSQSVAQSELFASLTRLISHTSKSPFGLSPQGFFDGPSSISFLFFKLHTLYPDVVVENRSLLYWANHYFHPSSKSSSPLPSTSRCGIASEMLATTVLSILLRPSTASTNVHSLSKQASSLAQDPRSASTEWLYGFSGLLYFLRVAYYYRSTHINDSNTENDRASLIAATRKVISRTLLTPQPWLWHEKAYLGAAHGSIGTLTQITLSTVNLLPTAERDPILTQVGEILRPLLTQQLPSGNFPTAYRSCPTTAPLPREDRLVQFCHGAPGILISLRSLRPHLPTTTVPPVDRAITLGESCIRSPRGVPDKEPCLCHGASGNALALADPRERFELLQRNATQAAVKEGVEQSGRFRASDHPWGLFGGEAGRAWAWAWAGAMVERGTEAGVLGYNDI